MIPVFKPSYGAEELEALREPFESGWIGLGPKTQEFEERFARYVGVDHAVGVNSATAALDLALKILEIGGGEVITTPMTFVSTNHAILYHRATPVFADIEPDTLNISADEVGRLITPRTRAIMCVHYGGHPCDMDAIHTVASQRNIPVIEDAAHACGAEYKGRRIGGLGDLTCFSFHAVKNLATGDGGMVTTDNADWDGRLRRLRWMGIDKSTFDRSIAGGKYTWSYQVDELGWKCHMNDITAALGLVQLGKLESANAKRRAIVEYYNSAFADLDWLETPVEKPYAKSSHHNYVVKVDKNHRDEFIDYLALHGVATSVHYVPNHLYELYRPFRRHLPIAEEVWQRIVTLPLFPGLTAEDIDHVVESVRGFDKNLH